MLLFYLGSFGASGTEHFDAYVWNPNTEHYDKIEEFKDIPNPKISDKYKCILSRVYVSSAENKYAKYVCTNGHLIKVAELRQYWKGTFIQSETGLFMKNILLKLMFGRET